MGKTKKHNFALQPALIDNNFCGTDAGFYLAKAMDNAVSLDQITTIENIKFKTALTIGASEQIVADANCDFSKGGGLSLTNRILEPKRLQVNTEICKSVLLSSWEALQMRAGAWNDTSPRYEDFLVSQIAQAIGNSVENSVWKGADANTGQFEGFTTASTGTFANDATVVTGGTGATFSATNVIAEIGDAVALVPAAVYGKEDLTIYMNYKTYRFYLSAISALGYVNAYNMNGDYVPVFEGVNISVNYGMPDNQLVVAQKSNLFFGTDLISDQTEIRLLDMTALDGSDNMRIIAKFSGGVQHGVGADIVWYK